MINESWVSWHLELDSDDISIETVEATEDYIVFNLNEDSFRLTKAGAAGKSFWHFEAEGIHEDNE